MLVQLIEDLKKLSKEFGSTEVKLQQSSINMKEEAEMHNSIFNFQSIEGEEEVSNEIILFNEVSVPRSRSLDKKQKRRAHLDKKINFLEAFYQMLEK
mmetsp:Transcript_3687/g.2753  ORF Transcript_3687/g.2753 Transcript_3687/m.2753 type:complete len:97 (-) Transcript_3687:538-828(-)